MLKINTTDAPRLKLMTIVKATRAPHVSANAPLQLLIENSFGEKGANYVKNILEVTCPTFMSFPFDRKQLV